MYDSTEDKVIVEYLVLVKSFKTVIIDVSNK